jgi:hypothetical protein
LLLGLQRQYREGLVAVAVLDPQEQGLGLLLVARPEDLVVLLG